jgi:hypothetical protein
MCKIVIQIHGFEPRQRLDVEPARRKRRLVFVDADQVPLGATDLLGRRIVADAEPVSVTAEPTPQTDARLVRDLQAFTDRMLLDAREGWKDAKVAAAELRLEYPAFMQRVRRRPPPKWIAHKDTITRKWKFDVPALRRWWAKQLVSGS